MQQGRSKFTGTLLGQIGVNILAFLITVLTLGIAYPWAMVLKIRWKVENSIIDGRRLIFTGSAASLFGHYIIWFLLTIITLGIYGFWLNIKIQQWITAHTHFM